MIVTLPLPGTDREVRRHMRYGAPMASPRSRHVARVRARRRRAQQRARALVALVALGVLGLVTLLLTAFDPGTARTAEPAAAFVVLPDTATGRPNRQPIATIGNLRLELPIAQSAVTGIGFHGTRDGALELRPVGRQGNEGLLARLWHRITSVPDDGLVWYLLDGDPSTEVVDIGAAPGTDVYAPVEGSVVGIDELVIGGRTIGSRIDIRPAAAPSVVVSLSQVAADPAIAVGSQVLAASSKLGTAIDIARVERQSLAAHTRGDGNNVSIAVYASPGSLP